jgi:hypothetical protein
MKALIKKALDAARRRALGKQLAALGDYGEAGFIREMSESLNREADKRGFDAKTRHYLLYSIQRQLMPKFVIADHGRVILDDESFRTVFEKFSDENWTSFERKWNLKELLRLTDGVAGHFAECGVFRGGSAYLMCELAANTNRQVHLFDSFEGLSEPNESEQGHWSPGDLSVSEEAVKENLSEFDCFKTFKGWIPDAFPQVADHQYSFLHVDVDLEQPTRDSIEFFYPRMDPGAVILLDDHGSAMCPGARKAALDFFGNQGEKVLDLATGQGLVIKRGGKRA